MIGMSIKRISVLNLCHVLKPFVKSTPDVYKVLDVTLPIYNNWIGDIQNVFFDLLLILQKLFSWENVPLKIL